MSLLEPYKISDIDFNNILFKKVKLYGNKKIIFLKYKNNKINNFVIQLSKINNNNVIDSNEIEFIIDNNSYTNFFENLDNYIIQQALLHHEWFDHLTDKDKSSISYQRILQENNSIKLRLCNNEELITKLFINDDQHINFDDVISNESTSKIIFEVYAIWVKTSSFGLLLRPVNIAMKFKEKPIYNYKFLDDSDNESNVSDLSESNFQTENNKNYGSNLYNQLNRFTNKKNNKDNNYEEDSNTSESSYEDSNNESDYDDNESDYNDNESESDNDKKKSNNQSYNKVKNNNQLFLKNENIFNNNSSLSTTDDIENDLNRVILG